jgi:hypothetical protein
LALSWHSVQRSVKYNNKRLQSAQSLQLFF